MAKSRKAGLDPCAAHIIKLHGLKEEDARKIVFDVDKRLKEGESLENLKKNYGLGAEDEFSLKQRIRGLLWQNKVIRDATSFVLTGNPKESRERLKAYLVGIYSSGTRHLDGIGRIQQGVVKHTMGHLLKAFGGMRKYHIRLMMTNSEFQKDVVRELHNFTGVTQTNNSIAFDLARRIRETNEKMVKELQAYGVPIKFLKDRIAATHHNPDFMMRAGEDEWVGDILRLADHQRTFVKHGSEIKERDPEKYLRTVYRHLTRGEEENLFDDMSDLMSMTREIHFKDADAWMEYSTKYSHNNHISAIFNGIEEQLNRTVLIERMGINPKKTFESILGEVNRQFEGSGVSIVDRALGKILTPENAWAQVSGEAYQTVGPRRARFVSMLNAINSMAVLGKAVFASFTDIASGAITLQYNGVGFLEAYTRQFKLLASRIPSEVRSDVFRSLGVGVDGILGAAVSKYMIDAPVAGTVSKMMPWYFLVNGLDSWTDYAREGVSAILSQNFAKNLGRSYDSLSPNFLRSLKQYGIEKKDWEIFQRAGSFRISAMHPELKGRALADEQLVTPDWISTRLGHEANISSIRKLQNYFTSELRTAIPEPGSAERAIMFRDWKRGSTAQSVASLLLQFQSYPVTLTRQVLPRLGQIGIPYGMAHMFPAMGLGYIGLMAKDLTAGREPRSPFAVSTWTKAAEASGMLGLGGEALGYVMSQENERIDKTLGGPNWAHVLDMGRVFDAMIKNEDWAWELFGTLKGKIPGANLFMTEWLFNHFFVLNIKETLRPGYASYYERFIEESKGTEYMDFFSPTESPIAIPHGGFF